MDKRFDPRLAWCALAVSAALLLIPVTASSQEQVTGSPACVLKPVTLPLFRATPAAIIAATPAVIAAGDDRPAPDTTTIEPAIEAIVACINSLDPTLRYAIFTDHYLALNLSDSDGTYQPAFEQQLDAGVDSDVPQFAIEATEQVTPLDDGRVSVMVTLSANGVLYQDRLVLADVGGTWLIDDVELIDPATPDTGT